MKTFKTAKDLLEYTKSLALESFSINDEWVESCWERNDDGAIMVASDDSTIAVFPPFKLEYVLVSDIV